MRGTFKRYIVGFVVFLTLLGAVLFWVARPRQVPPLPFDTKVFVSTSPPRPLFELAPNASTLARIKYSLFNLLQKLPDGTARKWYFSPSLITRCSIQGLLNQCAEVTDSRYFMPEGVAAGFVVFGHTNTLSGEQWVAAFESALQTGDTQIWDKETKLMRSEHLVLLRFPAQKATVVLPKSEVADFERTNKIHLPDNNSQ